MNYDKMNLEELTNTTEELLKEHIITVMETMLENKGMGQGTVAAFASALLALVG